MDGWMDGRALFEMYLFTYLSIPLDGWMNGWIVVEREILNMHLFTNLLVYYLFR